MLHLLVVTGIVGCATALGALPILLTHELPRRGYDTLLGLGAGLMLAAATLGLLPAALADVRHDGGVDLDRLLTVLAGMGGGVLVLFAMDRLIPHSHAGGHHHHMQGLPDEPHADCHHPTAQDRARHQGLLVLGAMSLHRLPEGFAIGAGFAASRLMPLGIMLAVAVAVQNAVEGMVMAAPLKRGGLKPTRLLGLVAATGLTVPIAGMFGYALVARAAGALPFMLSMAAGALIYLTCSEIIPESHSHGNERSATFALLAGFVLIIVIRALVGE
jgi:ZIP family zinc transporter